MNRFYIFISFIYGIIFTASAQQDFGFAADDYIVFYKKYLSDQKNSRCAMYPSCSDYGKMVFRDRPFTEAVTLLAERLIRCSHEQHFYDITYNYGYRSLVDFPYYCDVPEGVAYNRYALPHTDNFKSLKRTNNLLAFINYLINKEEYQNALIEIERATFNKQTIDTVLFAKKLLCYRALNHLEKGIFEYEVELPDIFRQNNDIAIQAALLYYVTTDYKKAKAALNHIVPNNGDDYVYEKACLLRGVISVRENDFLTAEDIFRNARLAGTNDAQYENNLNILANIEKQKRKNPTIARILSIVPGLGYLYTDHKGSALTSFVINSLLGYATYTSIKSENYGVAGLCGFLGLSFYIGNISGAGRSATRYNESKRENNIRRLENINHIFY